MDDWQDPTDRLPTRIPYIRQLIYLMAVSLLLLVFVAGCGNASNNPGVANLESTATKAAGSSDTSATPSAPAITQANALAYAQCMRSHGIPDFPDPNSRGGFAIQAHPGSDLDKNNPTFQAASNACESLRPVPSAAQQQQMHDQMLKYSQCMRAHGIADFPDPSATGDINISGGQGSSSSDLNPNNPTFQAAQSACQSLMPGGKAGVHTSTKQGGN